MHVRLTAALDINSGCAKSFEPDRPRCEPWLLDLFSIGANLRQDLFRHHIIPLDCTSIRHHDDQLALVC